MTSTPFQIGRIYRDSGRPVTLPDFLADGETHRTPLMLRDNAAPLCDLCDDTGMVQGASIRCPVCKNTVRGTDHSSLTDAETQMRENTMTNEAPNPLLDAEQREYLLAAAKHRSRLQLSADESIFTIASRLKEMIEKKRAEDAAAQRRPKEPVFDASAHRAGWRTDARFKRQEEQEEEGDDEDENEKALSDARREHEEYLATAYKQKR